MDEEKKTFLVNKKSWLWNFLSMAIILSLVGVIYALFERNQTLQEHKHMMIMHNVESQNQLDSCKTMQEVNEKLKFKTNYLLARFATDKYVNGKLVSSNSKLNDILDAAWKITKTKKTITPMMAMLIVHVESRGNPYAVSNKLCYGLTQVNYKVWHTPLNIDISRIWEIEYNMELGLGIFEGYLEQCKGNVIDALKMYNGGPGGMEFTGSYAQDVITAFNTQVQILNVSKPLAQLN